MGTVYEQRVRKRGCIHFLVGLFVRIPPFLKFSYSRLIARAKGATIDRSATFPAMFKLGMMAILLPCYVLCILDIMQLSVIM